jgi:uncharacterized protein YjdB
MLIAGTFFGFGWSAPEAAYAGTSEGATIDVSDSLTESGTGWSYDSEAKTFTIADEADVTVTGSTTTNHVVVASGANATVTLNNVNIDFSEVETAEYIESGRPAFNYNSSLNTCAFNITGATVNLRLIGENTLKSGAATPGIRAPEGSTLTIEDDDTDSDTGTLTAEGRTFYDTSGNDRPGAAGIGGASNESGGTIIINSGNITANGSNGCADEYGGAGIGGGIYGSGGTITITGGIVNATPSFGGAGIGGGSEGGGGNITICGNAQVFAMTDYYGAGIGGGYYGNAGNIIIGDNAKVVVSICDYSLYGTGCGIGVGGTTGGSIEIKDNAQVTASSDYIGIGGFGDLSVNITGGIITATGGYGAGIGTSEYAYGDVEINITGGIITATGSDGYDGIGGKTDDSTPVSGEISGDAVIISNTPITVLDKDKGIIFEGDTGTVYGDVELQNDFEIPADATLTIPDSASLTVSEDVTLTNNGEIVNEGTFTNEGTFVNEGVLTNENAATITNGSEGTISNGSTGTITNNSGGEITNNGTLDNTGEIANEGALTNGSDGQIANEGALTNSGGGEITNNGTLDNTGEITNEGEVGGDGFIFGAGEVSGSGDFSVLTGLTVSLTPDNGKVTLAPQTEDTGFAFYYTSSTASAAKPTYGDEIGGVSGAAAYTATTDINGENGTELFVQVYKVETTGDTIIGYGEASATPVDTEEPTITAVMPSGANAPIAGNAVITFSEPMDTAAGTVKLNDAITLSGGSWTNSTTYSIPYSGLAYSTTYTVNISGFKDVAKNEMAAVTTGHTFTTMASPKITVASVTITGAPAKFAYKSVGNNTLQLSANVLPANATNKTVTWKSSNPKIAMVNTTGLVTFVGAEGSVIITATATDGSGKLAQVTINSVKNVTGIRTPLSTVYIKKGTKNFVLPVVLDDSTNKKVAVTSKLTWKSSNTKAVTVKNGKITAAKNLKKKTTVKITVTAANGKSKVIKVIVVPKAMKLKKVTAKMPKKNAMKAGATYQLKVKLSSASATGVSVTFKSSKASVLKVDKAGKLIALKKGTAKITITAGGKKFTNTITVKK